MQSASSSTGMALPSAARREKFNSGASEAGMGRPGSSGRFPPARPLELPVTPGPVPGPNLVLVSATVQLGPVPNLVLREGPQRQLDRGLGPSAVRGPEPLPDTRWVGPVLVSPLVDSRPLEHKGNRA